MTDALAVAADRARVAVAEADRCTMALAVALDDAFEALDELAAVAARSFPAAHLRVAPVRFSLTVFAGNAANRQPSGRHPLSSALLAENLAEYGAAVRSSAVA